ncbi:MAG: oligosaccharide flippase family protein [Terriglobia bacterium]
MPGSSKPTSLLRSLAETWSSSLVISNTVWVMAGHGVRLLIQAAYFIIIARCLGVKQYGAFIGATALISVLVPFVGLGSGFILIKNVARDKALFAEYWGNGLLITMVSGVGLFVAAALLCSALLPIPALAVVFIGLSDLIFVRMVDMAGWAFQAFETLSKTARLNVFLSLTRLFGIGGLALAAGHPTVVAWAAAYLAGSMLTALIAVTWATVSLGRPRLALARLGRREIVEGFYFSVSGSAYGIYNDIDKTMLARLSTLEATGIYGAAYRLIDVACIPLTALTSAAYAGFFREGKDGLAAALHYGQRLLRRFVVYPLFAFVALFIGAPMVPRVLGHQYLQVAEAVRWLALLPLLRTFQYFVADPLAASGHQGLRTLAHLGVAVFNVLINLWIIPAYGWRGAAWSSIACDGLLAGALWFAANRLARRPQSPCEHVAMAATGSV